MFEVERKRELPDAAVFRQRLDALGYRESSSHTEVDTCYSRPDIDFMATVECLRVRRREGFAEVTYKPPSDAAAHSPDDVITKQEINVELADADQAGAADALLRAVGMVELVRVEKARTTYRHPDAEDPVVSIDVVTGVGAFIETEVTAVDSDAAAERLRGAERALDASDYPPVRLPYRDLVLAAREAASTTGG